MQFEMSFTVAASRSAVWTALCTPDVLVPCLPGALLIESTDESFAGRLTVKIGTTSITYQGTGSYLERHRATSRIVWVLEGRAIHGKATATAKIAATLLTAGSGSTSVNLYGDYSLTGGPDVRPSVLDLAAQTTADEFAVRLNKRLRSQRNESATLNARVDAPKTASRRSPTSTAERAQPRPAGTMPPQIRVKNESPTASRTTGRMRTSADAPEAGWYHRDDDVEYRYWSGQAWTAQRSNDFSAFLSYARDDRRVMTNLSRDIERLRIPVWFDDRLHGGEQWWRRILDEISSCGAVVYAVSDRSLDSEFCRLELAWARKLGISIIPVQVGDVANPRTHEITRTQLIDYRKRGADQAIQLAVALTEARRRRRSLPDPLPPAIAMPYAGLSAIRDRLRDRELSMRDQREILSDIEGELTNSTPLDVKEDLARLLDLLRNRDDVALRVARDAERLMRDCGYPPQA